METIQKILTKIAEAKISRNAILNLGSEEKLQQIQKAKIQGTTILALKCKDGVIMAADRRCTAGGKVFSDKEIKIEETGSMSCIGSAGWVSDCQWLVKILRQELLPDLEKFWEIDEIFVDGQANLVNFIMERILLMAWPILAGFDPYQNTGRIFLFEPGGAKFEPEDYITCGSGESEATGVLDLKWSCDCSLQKGIEIAIEALLASGKTDLPTSNSLLYPPIVKIISSDGISTLPTEKAFKIAWKKAIKEQVRKGDKEGVGAFIVDYFLKELSNEELGKSDKKNKNIKKPEKEINGNDNSKS